MEKSLDDISRSLMGIGKELGGIRELLHDFMALAKKESETETKEDNLYVPPMSAYTSEEEE